MLPTEGRGMKQQDNMPSVLPSNFQWSSLSLAQGFKIKSHDSFLPDIARMKSISFWYWCHPCGLSMEKRKQTLCWPAKITFIAVTELGFRLTGQTKNEWALIRTQTADWIIGSRTKTHIRVMESQEQSYHHCSTTNWQRVKCWTRLLSCSRFDDLMWTRWADDRGNAGVSMRDLRRAWPSQHSINTMRLQHKMILIKEVSAVVPSVHISQKQQHIPRYAFVLMEDFHFMLKHVTQSYSHCNLKQN